MVINWENGKDMNHYAYIDDTWMPKSGEKITEREFGRYYPEGKSKKERCKIF